MKDGLTPTERGAERLLIRTPLHRMSCRHLEARLRDAEWIMSIYPFSTGLCMAVGEHVDAIRRELRRRDGR